MTKNEKRSFFRRWAVKTLFEGKKYGSHHWELDVEKGPRVTYGNIAWTTGEKDPIRKFAFELPHMLVLYMRSEAVGEVDLKTWEMTAQP